MTSFLFFLLSIVSYWSLNTSKNVQALEKHVSLQIKSFIDKSGEANDAREEFQLNSHKISCTSISSFKKVNANIFWDVNFLKPYIIIIQFCQIYCLWFAFFLRLFVVVNGWLIFIWWFITGMDTYFISENFRTLKLSNDLSETCYNKMK